jgi:hypothetical protein
MPSEPKEGAASSAEPTGEGKGGCSTQTGDGSWGFCVSNIGLRKLAANQATHRAAAAAAAAAAVLDDELLR